MREENKYRVWDKRVSKMYTWEIIKHIPFYSFENEDYVFMKYIGLKDKNGKEIYEGDMINAWDDYFTEMGRNKVTGIIEFYENAFMLKSDKNVYMQHWPSAEEIEVIGNIYENPELLKKG